MASRLDYLLEEAGKHRAARDTSGWSFQEAALLEACHPKQRAFVVDPGRRVAALVARGGGKTTAGRARFVRRMLRVPKAQCLYVATTRQQALELMWPQLKDLLERLSIEARFNETQLTCTLVRNGARLRLVGADDRGEIEKLRGQPFHEVGIDEAASFDARLLNNLVTRVIGPRLGDHGGVLWCIGTPGHLLVPASKELTFTFFDVTRPGSEKSRPWDERDRPEYADWSRWSQHRWTLQDGAPHVPAMARLWAEALVEKEANGWTDANPTWRREYKGEWAPDDTETVFRYRAYLDDGTPWNSWCDGRYHAGAMVPAHAPLAGPNPFGLPPEHQWRYVFGMDMGHSDPFALEVLAHSDTCKDVYHVYEFVRRGMYARTIAEHLIGPELDHDKPAGVMRWTGWPDGMVADLAGLGNALRDELAAVYGVAIDPAEKKNKFDAIELANGDLVDGRVKFMRGSKLEAEVMSLLWDIDDAGKLREDKAQDNHCSDAFIYGRRKALHLFSRAAPPPPPRPGTREAKDEWAARSEERAAKQYRRDQDDFADWFGDDNFEGLFR